MVLIFLIRSVLKNDKYHKRKYDLNVMRQSACLMINPIKVDNFAELFNCTPVERASDSVMAPT